MREIESSRKPLLVLTLISFGGAGILMSLLTLFVSATALWGTVHNLSYWSWLSASATVVQTENSEDPGTYNRSRSITSCPIIRFSDRTGKSYEVRSTCTTTGPTGDRRQRGLRPAYRRGQTVTVWYDPKNPSRTLIAEHKPQFNPLYPLFNCWTLLFGSMAVGFLFGAKISRDELRKSN